jgi:hypothetical protein
MAQSAPGLDGDLLDILSAASIFRLETPQL